MGSELLKYFYCILTYQLHFGIFRKSITPNKNTAHKCNDSCVWCLTPFAIFDNPQHIGRVRNIDKQNALLKSKILNFKFILQTFYT